MSHIFMSRKCQLTSRGVQSGNNVSHSQRKTRRKFLPNLQNATFLSQVLKKVVSFRLSARAIKTISFVGGIDEFLVRASSSKLDKNALRVKKAIEQKIHTTTAYKA